MDAHHHEPVRAEPDLIPVTPVIVGVLLVIGSFLSSIFWSYKIQRREEASQMAMGASTEEIPAEARDAFKYEVGIINMEQFESESRAYTLQSQQRKSLQSYGWQDRKMNLAHVPVSEGMKKVAAQYGGAR